jgi:hypothetical protein
MTGAAPTVMKEIASKDITETPLIAETLLETMMMVRGLEPRMLYRSRAQGELEQSQDRLEYRVELPE